MVAGRLTPRLQGDDRLRLWPLPRAQGNSHRYSTKLHRNGVHTRLITRDHVSRRTDQCNLHTQVIAYKNKSPR
eukprot:scaffold54260_cov68-Phaeocystis_antarctica.AAC.3